MTVQKSGFVIDAPQLFIQASDGTDYHVAEAASGEVKLAGSSVEIGGGWGLYALANIPSGMGLDISISDAKFNTDAMVLSTGATKIENVSTVEYMFGVPYTVDSTTHSIILDYVAVANSVNVAGLVEDESATPSATQFKVTPNTPVGQTTVLFNTAMDNKIVYPKGEKTSTGSMQLSVLETSIPKTGLCIVKFPIYSDQSSDSTIACYGQFVIHKCQILANQSYGGSRKSANTFNLNLKGLNPNRSDKEIFKFNVIA